MPTISSPLGTRTFQSSMKEFVIPDGEDPSVEESRYAATYGSQGRNYAAEDPIRNSIEEEKRMMEMRRGTDKVLDGARKRIEILCGMTRVKKEVDIDGNVFVLKSLKSKETRDALAGAIKYDGTIEFIYELRRQVLSRSIEEIAGIEFESFIGSNKFNARLEFIDELDESVADKLYVEYTKLSNEIKSKYAVTTEQDIKELAEDIKK